MPIQQFIIELYQVQECMMQPKVMAFKEGLLKGFNLFRFISKSPPTTIHDLFLIRQENTL